MKAYIQNIEDYDNCTKEDLIEIINDCVDKLNFLLNLIYSSGNNFEQLLDDFDV